MEAVGEPDREGAMRIHDSPCDRDCPERSFDPNCHGTCKRYKDWLFEQKQRRKEARTSSAWTESRGNAATRALKYITKKDRGILH